MTAVFVSVVLVRFLLPLLIPRYPLPAIIGCLVVDAVDQSIFQAFGYDPPGYQSYDKAMDVFYLAIAYLSTLRNWVSNDAFRVEPLPLLLPPGRGGRLRAHADAGAAADLPQHLRVLLHRLRRGPVCGWSTLRLHLTGWLVVAAAASGCS